MSETIEYKTRDHPEAGGRAPQSGDRQYSLTLPLDDGRTLKVLMGKEDMRNLRNIVLAELVDDEQAGGN